MARPKSFDENTVLDQVMVLFWTQGYGATSMMDIQKATGLKPGSIYDGFGDKHALFIKAIHHYRDQVVRKRLSALNMPGPARQRIEAFFNEIIEFSLGEGKQMGCLMSNSAVELAQCDPEIRELVQSNLVEIASSLCDVVEQGIAQGEFKTTEPPENIGRFFVSTLQGLRVMAKSSTTKETLTTTVRLALKVLD